MSYKPKSLDDINSLYDSEVSASKAIKQGKNKVADEAKAPEVVAPAPQQSFQQTPPDPNVPDISDAVSDFIRMLNEPSQTGKPNRVHTGPTQGRPTQRQDFRQGATAPKTGVQTLSNQQRRGNPASQSGAQERLYHAGTGVSPLNGGPNYAEKKAADAEAFREAAERAAKRKTEQERPFRPVDSKRDSLFSEYGRVMNDEDDEKRNRRQRRRKRVADLSDSQQASSFESDENEGSSDDVFEQLFDEAVSGISDEERSKSVKHVHQDDFGGVFDGSEAESLPYSAKRYLYDERAKYEQQAREAQEEYDRKRAEDYARNQVEQELLRAEQARIRQQKEENEREATERQRLFEEEQARRAAEFEQSQAEERRKLEEERAKIEAERQRLFELREESAREEEKRRLQAEETARQIMASAFKPQLESEPQQTDVEVEVTQEVIADSEPEVEPELEAEAEIEAEAEEEFDEKKAAKKAAKEAKRAAKQQKQFEAELAKAEKIEQKQAAKSEKSDKKQPKQKVPKNPAKSFFRFVLSLVLVAVFVAIAGVNSIGNILHVNENKQSLVGNYLLFTASQNVAEAEITAGDLVVIRPCETVLNGEKIAYINEGGYAFGVKNESKLDEGIVYSLQNGTEIQKSDVVGVVAKTLPVVGRILSIVLSKVIVLNSLLAAVAVILFLIVVFALKNKSEPATEGESVKKTKAEKKAEKKAAKAAEKQKLLEEREAEEKAVEEAQVEAEEEREVQQQLAEEAAEAKRAEKARRKAEKKAAKKSKKQQVDSEEEFVTEEAFGQFSEEAPEDSYEEQPPEEVAEEYVREEQQEFVDVESDVSEVEPETADYRENREFVDVFSMNGEPIEESAPAEEQVIENIAPAEETPAPVPDSAAEKEDAPQKEAPADDVDILDILSTNSHKGDRYHSGDDSFFGAKGKGVFSDFENFEDYPEFEGENPKKRKSKKDRKKEKKEKMQSNGKKQHNSFATNDDDSDEDIFGGL